MILSERNKKNKRLVYVMISNKSIQTLYKEDKQTQKVPVTVCCFPYAGIISNLIFLRDRKAVKKCRIVVIWCEHIQRHIIRKLCCVLSEEAKEKKVAILSIMRVI